VTLARRLADGPLPINDLLQFSVEIAEALARAHRQGIIHRDGYGFAFAADAVDDRPSSSPCFLTIGDHDFVLAEGENIIGREWDAAVRIDAPSI
jgi:serine/threonine protein kinase